MSLGEISHTLLKMIYPCYDKFRHLFGHVIVNIWSFRTNQSNALCFCYLVHKSGKMAEIVSYST